MKKIKALPKIKGSIGTIFNQQAVYCLCKITNAQSDTINYLIGVIEDLENRIKILEEKTGGENE